MSVEREELKRRIRERLAGKKPPKRTLPWKPIALVLIAVIAVIAVAIWMLWGRPNVPSENVYFGYRMMFYYQGSEDNEPLENLALRFSAPKIENDFAGSIYAHWELYYVEDDNSLTLESTKAGIEKLRGQRSSQLRVYTSGIEYSAYGPTLSWEIDWLYPREVFIDAGWTWVPKEKASTVTLRRYGIQEDWSSAYWHTPKAEQENKRIDFTFAAGLYRENTLIERYEVSWENETWGAFFLARTV